MKQRHILVFGMLMTVLSAAFFFSCEHPVDQVQTQNKAVPPQDVTPPAPVTNLTASYSSDNQTITVIWQNPTDEDFKELQLICKKDNTVVKQETLGKDKTGFTVTGIPEDGSTYTITLKAKDNAGNESSPAEVTVTALVTPEITEIKLDRTRLDTAVADRNITVTIKGQHFRKLTKLVVRVTAGSQTQQEQEAVIDVTNNTATATLQAPIPSTPPLTKHGIYYKVNIFIDGTMLAGKWASFTVTPPAKVDSIYVYPSSIPFNFTEPVTVTVKGSNLDLRGETEIKLFDSHGNEVPSSTVTVEANVGKNIEKFEKKITPPFASGTYTVKVFFKGIAQSKTAKLKRYEAPEITSVTIPKAGTSYSGKMLPVTVRGKNFSGLNTAFSVSGARFTDFKVWSNTEATTEIECPSVAGNTVITVHCGTASKTGMLSVIDSSAYAPGMIVLADKTLTAKEAYTAINPSNPPVGIVFDIYGVPKILALHVSGQKLSWARQSTPGYTKRFEGIICMSDRTKENGAAGAATFRGDTDGSDNWTYIKSVEPAGTADAATNYPAFNWVNTYNTTYAAQLGTSHLAWYMPSVAELCEIYKNKEKIDASLKAIHDLPDGGTYADTSFKSESYWSSSQVQDFNRDTYAWNVSFGTGYVTTDERYLDILTCAIADF